MTPNSGMKFDAAVWTKIKIKPSGCFFPSPAAAVPDGVKKERSWDYVKRQFLSKQTSLMPRI
jgi:hypothetical protein